MKMPPEELVVALTDAYVARGKPRLVEYVGGGWYRVYPKNARSLTFRRWRSDQARSMLIWMRSKIAEAARESRPSSEDSPSSLPCTPP
jgi:hypothetical protein